MAKRTAPPDHEDGKNFTRREMAKRASQAIALAFSLYLYIAAQQFGASEAIANQLANAYATQAADLAGVPVLRPLANLNAQEVVLPAPPAGDVANQIVADQTIAAFYLGVSANNQNYEAFAYAGAGGALILGVPVLLLAIDPKVKGALKRRKRGWREFQYEWTSFRKWRKSHKLRQAEIEEAFAPKYLW